MEPFFYHSPLGWLRIESDQESLQSIKYCKKGAKDKSHRSPIMQEKIQRELEEYFEGKRTVFSLALGPVGTPFQKKVWEYLLTIPYGQTRTYGQVARAIGRPKAARAVGMALNKNPIPIVVPCHRVVGSAGKLTGYAGGLDKKKWLLKHEGAS
ncbi:methylated-DNA--[protein]-cysteine S-methyltransferase [Candidatus Woesebacteria bacterium]|nr:methylated-DNA--[protein]-cysteine S-methyltransferase [Candidatus Woesebacteria bacterium]